MWHKSPFNYIGNKYRMIADLQEVFPAEIATFVDLFCGGGDVLINTNANHKIANDINYHLIDILKTFQAKSLKYILEYIDSAIAKWGLSKTNEEAYIIFREHYNSNPNALDLFLLICYGFNHQFRFNSLHQFNNPFGRNRSSFSDNMRHNLMEFVELIKGVELSSFDFREFDYDRLNEGDFVYADPPYTLTCGSYNDGKRGFKGWDFYDDNELIQVLDKLNDRGVKFALSNVIEHKGKTHPYFLPWVNARGYNMHFAKVNYNNCNYQAQNRLHNTVEVVITNY